jgi:biopolymer transport protein ExbB
MKKFIILVAILSLPFLARAQWVVSGTTYSFRNKLTINGSQVCGGSSLSNFTILVQLTTNKLKVTGSGGLVNNTNGYDIVFTAADGSTKLDHQIDHYTGTAGDYGAWVRIPTLLAGAGNNTDIYMYYGSSTVSTDPSVATTWDANFKTIYHFQNGNFNDATSNGMNSTNHGTTNLTGAWIGDGRAFDPTLSQ